jgi:chromosome segregation ATPase
MALARRTLAAALGSQAWLRLCFGAWAAFCSDAREGRLQENVQRVEADLTRLASEASFAQSEAENARAATEAREKEIENGRRLVEESSQRLEEALAQVSHWQAQAEQADTRLKALVAEVEELRNESEAVRGKAGEESKNAEERRHSLQSEADALRDSLREAALREDKASEDASRLTSEAVAREAAVREELKVAKDALAKAREAEANAMKQRDDARARTLDHETQRKAVASELESAHARAAQLAKDAQAARGRAEEAEKRIRDLQSTSEELQRRVQALEARETEASKSGKAKEEFHSAEIQRSKGEADTLARKNAELTAEASSLRTALAESKCDVRSATEKLRKLGEERGEMSRKLDQAKVAEQEVERRSQEMKALASQFADEARHALEDARQNIRIMVTAPKVSVNVGGNSVDMHTPFPFSAIKEAVQREVLPIFSRVFTVGEQAGDMEIRRDVQEMVEKLALTLQTKVHELLPQAEGTCNWDGFGAKCGGLGRR